MAPYVKNASVWYCPSVGPDYVWQHRVDTGDWKKGMTMRTQGTSYSYIYLVIPFPSTTPWDAEAKLMGGKSYAILQNASRWPMLIDEPYGCGFTDNLADPPSSVVPHSGGLNVAYGDGHSGFHRMETADGNCSMVAHLGDGIYPGQ